jgi:hypothetical protein
MVVVLAEATVPAVTIPVADPTEAIPDMLLLHVPPPASDKVVVRSEQTLSVPSMAVGNGLTVTTAVIIHPVGKVYVMVAVLATVTVPAVTIPEADPTVAIPVALLLHVPPDVASLSVVVRPEQTESVPSMGVETGFTVTTPTAMQPVVGNT